MQQRISNTCGDDDNEEKNDDAHDQADAHLHVLMQRFNQTFLATGHDIVPSTTSAKLVSL